MTMAATDVGDGGTGLQLGYHAVHRGSHSGTSIARYPVRKNAATPLKRRSWCAPQGTPLPVRKASIVRCSSSHIDATTSKPASDGRAPGSAHRRTLRWGA